MIFLATQAALITYSIIIFLVVTLLLVGILVYAKNKLSPSGTVKVKINHGEIEFDGTPGNTLLDNLQSQKIFLPSACGGKGSCGMCRCQVEEGAGSILPTETGFFSRKEQKEHWRLACQVKVKEDILLELEPAVLGIKKWECTVVSNDNVATFIKEFVVKLPEGEQLKFRSGGYIQIDVPKIDVDFKDMIIGDKWRGEWEQFGMFDLKMKNPEPTYRAYSMANHPAEGNIVMLNIRIATPAWDRVAGRFQNVNPGICSSYIFSRKPGDKVTISGPYGEFFIKDTQREMMFIGGGAGMAPMRSHIFHLFQTVKTGRKVTFWYGARSRKEIFYEDQFRAIEKDFPNFTFTIALSEPHADDNWTGPVGFIHQVIHDNYLVKHEEPEDIEYYLCGPPMMNSAINKMLDNLGVPKEMIAYDDFGA
jgi:NADH:ubiquinone oxidoreductase, Na(+)-translocating, F subunit